MDRAVRHAGRSDSRKILKAEALTLKKSGDAISITGHDPPNLHQSFWDWFVGPDLEVHYEITVPRKFAAQLKTSGGGIKIAGLHGSVDANTMGGSLNFSDIDGRVNGQTMGGSVHASSCRDGLEVHTMGGSITIEDFSGSHIRASTAGGSVSAGFAAAPTADCELRTSGGSIHARLPARAAVTLDAHTVGGSVRTDLPVQTEDHERGSTLRGTINGGGPLLKLETTGGSIDISKQ